MWLSLILGRAADIWRGLPASWRGFILGTVVGTTLLSGSCALLRGSDTREKVAVENLKASLDSTRAISAQHDTVYARLLAQKDVRLAGALASAANSQHDKPKAVVTVTTRGRGVDTTASHPRTGKAGEGASPPQPVRGSEGSGGKDDSPPPDARLDGRQGSITDSLVLRGPAVVGTVRATVTDSTWLWSARLRPSPVDVTLALTCGKNGPEALVKGPSFVEVAIQPGQVDSKVCHPAPSHWAGGFKSGVVVTAAVYVGIRVVKSLITKGK